MEISTVIPPVNLPVSMDVVASVLRNIDLDIGFFPPSILEEMSKSSSALATLERLKVVVFGGGKRASLTSTVCSKLANGEKGPLSQNAGDLIAKHTEVRNMLGTTESASFPTLTHSPEDWPYLKFDPSLKGFQFRPRMEDLFELVLVRDDSTEKFTSTWNAFPDLSELATKDLYVRHPSKSDLWLLKSRLDDILVLSNGEKVFRLPLEDGLRIAPIVSEVMVIGHSRFEVAALIELRGSAKTRPRKELMEELASYIEKANETMPGHGKLSEDRIMFTKPVKPLLRTSKGSLMREAIVATYSGEIDELYSGSASDDLSFPPLMVDGDQGQVEKSISEAIQKLTRLSDLSSQQDFFRAGINSLHVMRLVRWLKHQILVQKLPISADSIDPGFIYSSPSITQLAVALMGFLDKQVNGHVDKDDARRQAMGDILRRYTSDLPRSIVLLSGSTGSLGSYLLDAMLADDGIQRIYCLNRAVDGETKQTTVSSTQGLSVDWKDKVRFVRADFSQANFGLNAQLYQELENEVTVIIRK